MNIGFNRNIGFILLAVYLILIGLTSLMPALAIPSIITSILALVSGICILLKEERGVKCYH